MATPGPLTRRGWRRQGRPPGANGDARTADSSRMATCRPPSQTADRSHAHHLRRLTGLTPTICDGSARPQPPSATGRLRGSVGGMSETRIPDELAVSPAVPDRNLALEPVRVTEAAAMAAGRWVGRGDKNGADGVAVNAMRVLISTVGMRGTVVIGEGEKDNAPMLFNGEEVGDGTGPECDVAVDPIDGTTLTAKGMANAVSVLAVSPRGSMYDPSAVFYMEKLVTGPEAADVVDIRYPVAENIHQVAKAKGSAPGDVTVVLLDRPRHQKLAEEIRATGARIKFIT